MKIQYATLKDGTPVPKLGLGTWKMGGVSSPDYSEDDRIREALRSAIEMGYTHIDTAEMYAAGHTEELIGQVISKFDRQKLFITTKVWPTNLRYRDTLDAIQGSLERLKTDYVDLYLIHWPSSEIPLEETFRALNKVVEREQARHIGVSNFDLRQLQHAQGLSQTPLATNQVPYSLLDRQYVRNGVLQYCQENEILLTAYSPIGKGEVLANREVQQIARQIRATPAQVALAWLIRQPSVIAIPKGTSREHQKENLGAFTVELSEQDVERLNQI